MDELERIKKLAGVDKITQDDSMGENLSYVGTAKAQYQRKHNIKPGTPEWFKLWFDNQNSRVKTQCPNANKYSHNASSRIHRNQL